MPTRSSSRPSPAASDMRRAIAYHATSITVLWVVIIAMSIGAWLTMLMAMVRLDGMSAQISMLDQRLTAASDKMVVGQEMQKLALPPVVPTLPTSPVPPSSPTSPSGLLVRGSLSPDGTKYAGYDDTTKGKMGIGVEILATKAVKHVVLFNTKVQTSGKGTAQESDMSVRWLDNNTIEYDQLFLEGSLWVKQTQTVKIFF